MKSLNLQFGDNRQNQREDMFLANIAEKVSSGKLSMIPFVDQAQFIDLITKQQKKKVKLQPIFSKVFALIKSNIAKHQQSQQKIQEVSYEIKTISSTRQLGNRSSFNVGNKSGGLLLRKDSNLKDQQTYEFSEKEIIPDDISKTARSSKHLRLQQLTDEKLDRRIKTSREDTQDMHNNISTGRNEKNTFNLQTQEHSDNSLLRMESQQSCAMPLDRLHALQTNFTTEISNANTKNHSATFQQPNSQRGSFGLINNETTKKPDVILKTMKSGFSNQGYLIQDKKPVVTQNVVKKTFSNPKQISVTPRSKNASKASNKQSTARQSPETKKKKEQKQDQKIEIKVTPGLSQEQQPQNEKQDEKIQQLQLNQETSFCGNVVVSQRAIKTEIDERHQDSPQFNKNETGEEVAISHSGHHSIPRSARQTVSYKPDNNPLNISQNSFQSKRHTIDQPDYNSLLPPQSSKTLRTLTSAKKDKTTEPRNSISNISEEQKPSQNQLSVNFKRGSKRMKSHNIQSNETEYNAEENERRYSQERIFKSDNRFERLVDERYQYTVNNLERTQSSSSINNQELDNCNQINIQVSRCDNREKIIEEESIDGSMQHNNRILFATQDNMHLKIGDNSFLPQSSSRSVVKSISPHTPAGSINTVQHSSSGTATNQQTQNIRRRKQQQISQPRRNQQSGDQSQTKIQYIKQKSEDSNYEKEYTNESSLEPEKPTRLKPKKPQKLMPPPLAVIQPQRRKSSAQVSPMDPRKAEQLDRERQKQMEYQKQIERMRLERELMEKYKIPDNMPLPEKKVIIESLINELDHQADQDIKYQVSLYNQRQDQIQNIQRNYEEKIDFRYNIVNSCYYEIDYLCDHKLKLKQKDQENQKIIHLKFQDQFANHAHRGNQQGDDKIDDEEASPYKKANKVLSSYDPVEIENYLKRKFEFVQETQLLHFLKQFESEFNKQVYQCHLDQPIIQDIQEDKNFTKGLLPRQMKRKQTKHISTKIEINNYQMDYNKMDYVKEKANRIQKMGQFLLMNS